MTDYVVTKSEILEIMTRIPAEIKLFKDLKTGRIVGELMIDSSFFGDFNLEKADLDCRPDDPSWKKFFEEQFNDFDYSTIVRGY